MEILVISMLSLFLAIIALAIVIYVLVRKNSVNRSFNHGIERDLDEFDDEFDDDDDEIPNIVLPSGFQNDYAKPNDVLVGNGDKEVELEVNEEVSLNNSVVKNEDIHEKMEEVVNILINKKNYIFLANGNQVSKNEHLKLVIDNKIYFGTVTKRNYQRDISLMKVKPKKLIVVKNKAKKEEKVIDDLGEVEFIPRRKNKN